MDWLILQVNKQAILMETNYSATLCLSCSHHVNSINGEWCKDFFDMFK